MEIRQLDISKILSDTSRVADFNSKETNRQNFVGKREAKHAFI